MTFKAGDWVWFNERIGKLWIEKYGRGPFRVVNIVHDYVQIYINEDVPAGGFYPQTLLIDTYQNREMDEKPYEEAMAAIEIMESLNGHS